MEIEIVYFEGCPNIAEAQQRVAVAIRSRADVTVRLRRVENPAEAEQAGMYGSPTILINSVDPFAGPDISTSWGCRYYPPSVGSHGVPSIAQLERKLAS